MPEQRGRGPDSWIINLSTELFPILDRFKERFIFGFLQRQPLYTRQANVSSPLATAYQQAYPRVWDLSMSVRFSRPSIHLIR